MAVQQTKGFLGWCAIKKTGGQTSAGPALSTIYSFPIAAVNPRNPVNQSYASVINAAGALSLKTQGKKTPSVSLRNIPLKTFFTNVFLQSVIGGATSYLDTSGNSDEYCIGINNGSSTRYYELCKCSQISLYQTAPGGPINLDMDWLAVYGDSELGTTTIATPSTDAGSTYDITKTDFNSTVDAVYSWRLTLMRPQAYQFECDGTMYSDTLQSGMIGGTFSYTTSPLSASVPSNQVTIKLGAAGGGVSIVCDLNLDEKAEDVVSALGTRSITYTLFKSTGAYPVTITSF